jgi:predicted ATP-dependent endonuclease of OLD family
MEKLIVKNFGPLKDIEIELKSFNLLIGEQSSGKSSIAKLLTILNNKNFLLEVSPSNDKDTELLYKEFSKYKIKTYFRENSYIEYHNKEGETIIFNQGRFSCNPHKEHAHEIWKSSLYIPAERNFSSTFSRALSSLVLNKIPIPTFLLEFMSVFDKAKNEYDNFDIPELQLKFQTGEKEFINLNGVQTPYDESSSGIQSVLPMMMTLRYASKVLSYQRFIIEEPESNLFPENQVKIMQSFVSILNENLKKWNMIITTHSPYLLTALNNMLEAGKLTKESKMKADEISQIIPKQCWLSTDNVTAYYLCNGTARNIIDEEYNIISADDLDNISNKISEQFDQLINLE